MNKPGVTPLSDGAALRCCLFVEAPRPGRVSVSRGGCLFGLRLVSDG